MSTFVWLPLIRKQKLNAVKARAPELQALPAALQYPSVESGVKCDVRGEARKTAY